MKTIAFVNNKGGVGKTTCAINVAVGLARAGKKVLVVDCDPQANLTTGLGIDENTVLKSLAHVLRGEATAHEVAKEVHGVTVIPSHYIHMDKVDIIISPNLGREYILKNALKQFEGYDYAIIDCAPTLNVLTENAATAANELYIVMRADYFSLAGMRAMQRFLGTINASSNASLKFGGIIINEFNPQRQLTQMVIKDLTDMFGDIMFKTHIRIDVRLAEAPSFGTSIYEHSSKSVSASSFTSLVSEIRQRVEGI
ncbi:MAG: ParA family protein [Planctomycetes bacterium]|nr:ParA family protein [Planctomycetota bacterium]